LAERATQRNDLHLSLDEIGVGDRKAIAKAAYQLATGIDKGRHSRREAVFKVLVTSTGELPLAEFIPNVQPGQLVRLVDIPAQVQAQSAFETIAENDIDAAAKRFYGATKKFHGAVGIDWLRYLVAQAPEQFRIDLQAQSARFFALPEVDEIRRRAMPQVKTVVNRFALIAAALAMAIGAGILPWSVEDSDAGIVACMRRWVRQRGNIDVAGEVLRAVRQRQQLLAVTLQDRFIHLRVEQRRLVPATASERRKLAMADQFDGYVKHAEDGTRILVKPDVFNGWWRECDADAVKKHLLQAGLLIPGAKEMPRAEKVSSGRPAARFYVLAATFIPAELRPAPHVKVGSKPKSGRKSKAKFKAKPTTLLA
jgi:hypothetical protein